jgi:integrase
MAKKNETTVADIRAAGEALWGHSSPEMLRRLTVCLEGYGGQLSASHLSSLWAADLLKNLSSVRGLSRKSVQDYYAALKRACSVAGVSVVDWPKAPTPARKERPLLTLFEAERVIGRVSASNPEAATAYRLMLYAGMRPAVEALRPGTSWEIEKPATEDEPWTGIRIREGKGGHQRRVVVGVWARPLEWLTSTAIDALASNGPTPRDLRRIWRAAVISLAEEGTIRRDHLEEPPSPHSLRHLYATEMRDRGAAIEHIRDLLGHASTKTTERYIHSKADSRELAYL